MKTSDDILCLIDYSNAFDKLDMLRCRLRECEQQSYFYDAASKDESMMRIRKSILEHINTIKDAINYEIDALNQRIN